MPPLEPDDTEKQQSVQEQAARQRQGSNKALTRFLDPNGQAAHDASIKMVLDAGLYPDMVETMAKVIFEEYGVSEELLPPATFKNIISSLSALKNADAEGKKKN